MVSHMYGMRAYGDPSILKVANWWVIVLSDTRWGLCLVGMAKW
jgi:hypothetical protein